MTLTPDPDNVPADPAAPDEPEYRDDGDVGLQPKVYDIDDDEKDQDDEQDEGAGDGDESSQR